MTRLPLLAFVLLLWVSYDFVNPDVPGAVVFNPDKCVDAVQKRQSLPQDQLASPHLVSHWQRAELLETGGVFRPPIVTYPDPRTLFSGWTVRAPRAHAPDPAPNEDH